jgi:DNA-binding beta-propeller fold protein YncE
MNLKNLLLPLLGMWTLIPNAAAASPSLTLKPEAPIEVSAAPKRFDLMAVDGSWRRLLAAHSQAGTLTVIDLSNRKQVAEIQVGRSSGVAIDAHDGKYFIGTKNGVAIVDRSTLGKAGFIPTPGPADAMVFDPEHDRLYVGHDDGKELWIIDARHDRITGSIAIPGAPELMGIDQRTHRLYLNIKPLNEVVVIDSDSDRVIAHWPTRQTNSPHGLALDLHDHRLFVAGRSRTVSVLSLSQGTPLRGIDIGPGRVDQIAYDADARRLYCPSSGRLVAISIGGKSDAVIASVKIPQSTHSVAVDPHTHWVWIAYADKQHSYIQAFAPKLQ